MADVRELLVQAQSLELDGDKPAAAKVMRQVAALYRDAGNATRALKMLRHARRLEGLPAEDDPTVPEPLPEAPPAPLEPESPIPGDGVLIERRPSLAPPDAEVWCSFCCLPQREVGRLVAAPTGTFICRGYVVVVQTLLVEGDG